MREIGETISHKPLSAAQSKMRDITPSWEAGFLKWIWASRFLGIWFFLQSHMSESVEKWGGMNCALVGVGKSLSDAAKEKAFMIEASWKKYA